MKMKMKKEEAFGACFLHKSLKFHSILWGCFEFLFQKYYSLATLLPTLLEFPER